ncbi:sugar ABC transporter permease [Microbacterium lacus]|uniref:Sugar ABC transporter permease n=1 Tax=Microbacterium lacus TaxID=415217 RepID=A0ABN2FYC8_9MICO
MTISEIERAHETLSRQSDPRPRRRGYRRGNTALALFILPGLVVFTIVVTVPVIQNFYFSFTDWNGFSPNPDFVGLKNFASMAGDSALVNAAKNTLIFTLITAPVQFFIALALAVSLSGAGRVKHFLRTVVVLPIAISGTVLGFLGTLIFDPGRGLLVGASHIPGLAFLDQNWLGDPTLAMFCVVAMSVWQYAGLNTIIFIAAIATVPQELGEAATIDGAGPWRSFWSVTWPMLAPAATINLVLNVIGGLKVFDVIYVLTKGGPAGATESVVTRVATSSSINGGYSAATSFVLTVLITLIAFVLLAILRRREFAA